MYNVKLMHIGLCVQPKPYNGFQQAFIDILGEENYREINCGDKELNKKSIEIFNEFKPDIVFMQIQTDGIIDFSTIEYFHSKGCKIINWTGDIRHYTPSWMLDIAPYCISAFSNMNDVKNVIKQGYQSKYLEIGYDPLIYTPIGEKAVCPEIVFMANNYVNQFPLSKYRANVVQQLTDEYGSRFGVYGSGWTVAMGNLNGSQIEEAKYYRGCKIAINISHFEAQRYSSDRLLRILGSGALCISHRFPNMDYKDEEHLLIFDDVEDLKDKINYYICHDSERMEIAKRGNELVLNRNTFHCQVKNILEL